MDVAGRAVGRESGWEGVGVLREGGRRLVGLRRPGQLLVSSHVMLEHPCVEVPRLWMDCTIDIWGFTCE